MSDMLLTNLRILHSESSDLKPGQGTVVAQAINEIERLRAENDTLSAQVDNNYDEAYYRE